jgi:CubicO group peptidase (beta-lactamase class C family)
MDRRSLLAGFGSVALYGCATPHLMRATSPSVASLPHCAELDERIEIAMNALAAIAGLSIAVYTPDGSYTRGFGVTEVGTGRQVTADTCFYIASATKPLTSLAMAILAAEGAINLDEALADFAPKASLPEAIQFDKVTMRHLLSHTSGISADPIAVRLAFTGQHTPAELWRLLGACEISEKKPFGVFGYTNTGYNIATILTDRRFDQLWQDILQKRIFDPAGMVRTAARMSTATKKGFSVAKPHAFLPEGISKLYLEKTDQTMHSAGGVIMSANDALRWLELMAELGTIGGRRVIPANAVQETRLPLISFESEFGGYSRRAYGLGWYHVPFRGELMLQHFGSFAGARAHVSYLPARRTGVAVFANDSTAGAPLADLIANFVFDRTAGRDNARALFDAGLNTLIADRDRMIERVSADRARRKAQPWKLKQQFSGYAGTYRNELYGDIEIRTISGGMEIIFGVMRASAEPGADPETVRVELVPATGEIIKFQDTARPALEYSGAIYERI